jgi:hypothetical protein
MGIWKIDEHGEQKMEKSLFCRIYHEREWKDGGVVFAAALTSEIFTRGLSIVRSLE